MNSVYNCGGRDFATLDEAKSHCEFVFRVSGVVLGIELKRANMQIENGGQVLCHTNGRPAERNVVVLDFRGRPATLLGGTAPRHAGSTGRVLVKQEGHESEFYPGVYNMKWMPE